MLFDPVVGRLLEEALAKLVAVDNVAALLVVGQHLPDVEVFVPELDLIDVGIDQDCLVVRNRVHIDWTRIVRRLSRAFYRIATGDIATLLSRLALELRDGHSFGCCCCCRKTTRNSAADNDYVVLVVRH